MVFVPPFHSKFGKNASDLLGKNIDDKKDDFKHQAVIKTGANNISVTTTVTAQDKAVDALAGKVNLAYVAKGLGELGVEYTTTNSVKGTLKFADLYKGLVVNTESVLANSKLSNKATVEYAQENIASTVEYDQKKNSLINSISLGFDGLSVGVTSNLNVEKAKAKSADAYSFNAGVQYEDGTITGALGIEGNKVSASIFHKVSSVLKVASKYTAEQSAQSIAIGSEYAISPVTSIKGKAVINSSQSYQLFGRVEHKLANPNVTVALAQKWDSVNKDASTFGVSLNFSN